MIHFHAPAKLNLYLRVLGKRPDGYHEIETLFERIDLADELTFESAADDIRLTCSDPSLSCGEDNLVLKAARLLQQISGTRQSARIHLQKQIPIGAGLGGGSSDAATTLQGLNKLWGLGLSRQQLITLGAQLGSDVAFFLHEAPFAIGRGRGERCEPVQTDLTLWQVLVFPHQSLSTKDIYAEWGSLKTGLTASPPSINMIEHALRNGPVITGLAQGLWNDLEPAAIRRCPVITQIQSQLQTAGCLSAHVSGSGSSVFGLCQDEPHAQDVMRHLQRYTPSWWTRIVHTERGSVPLEREDHKVSVRPIGE